MSLHSCSMVSVSQMWDSVYSFICAKRASSAFRFMDLTWALLTDGRVRAMLRRKWAHNDTFLVTCQMAEGKTRRYILQRMNQEVFKNPKELMENVTGVTTFYRIRSGKMAGIRNGRRRM